jgi:hypothetical protein
LIVKRARARLNLSKRDGARNVPEQLGMGPLKLRVEADLYPYSNEDANNKNGALENPERHGF